MGIEFKYRSRIQLEQDRIDTIIKNNNDFIIKNLNNIDTFQMSKELEIPEHALKSWCKRNNLFYLTKQSMIYEKDRKIIIGHKQYLQNNPDNLTYIELAKKLNLNVYSHLQLISAREGINIKKYNINL